jgi:outer membrane protein assembly factor BamB
MKKFQYEKLAVAVILVGGVFPSLVCEHSALSPEHDNWPMFMHDYRNTGYSPSAAPDSPHLLWTFDTEQRLFSSPVVYNGTVYQGGRGYLFALDAETGEILWSSRLPVVGSTPIVTEEYLYVGTCNGMAALNSENGELIWQVQLVDFKCDPWGDDLPSFLSSSPIETEKGIVMCAHRNILYSTANPFPEGINRIVCLDPKNGTLLWQYHYFVRAGYSPALIDGRIVLNSEQLKILDVETGQELWSYATDPLGDTSPVVTDSTIVTVSSDDGIVYAFDLDTQELLWTHSMDTLVLSTPAVYENEVLIVTYDETIYALDEETGDVLWDKNVKEESHFPGFEVIRNVQAGFSSSPAIADNKVYVGLWSGTFLCLEVDTGEILWKYETGGSIKASPAIADEKVFISSTDGKVYCFGIDPETYFEKAEGYRKQRETEKAKEFYIRAQDYYESQGDQKMVKKCEDRLEDKTNFWIETIAIICTIIGVAVICLKRRRTK